MPEKQRYIRKTINLDLYVRTSHALNYNTYKKHVLRTFFVGSIHLYIYVGIVVYSTHYTG